jgi:hypothetical protein
MRRVFVVLITLLVLVFGQQELARFTSHLGLGEQINLLTGRNLTLVSGGCYTYYQNALLVVDKTYGTAMADRQAPPAPSEAPPLPIMWPIGYTGYRVGPEIAVVDESGHVVAVTGQRYWITLGGANLDIIEPNVPGTWLACGPPTPGTLASPSG